LNSPQLVEVKDETGKRAFSEIEQFPKIDKIDKLCIATRFLITAAKGITHQNVCS
jgi:hypothetical protein